MLPSINSKKYGIDDSSFLAAGGAMGLQSLCHDFYQIMDTLPVASHIREMHKADLTHMQSRLALFLSAWLGGPRDWFSKYNYPPIPLLHKNFVINDAEVKAWLTCMDQAIDKQSWELTFKDYLKAQFRAPANMVKKFSLNQ